MAASRVPFEAVALLLWLDCDLAAARTAALSPFGRNIGYPVTLSVRVRKRLGRPELNALHRFSALLPLAEHNDPGALDVRRAALAATGARILRVLTAAAIGTLATPPPAAPSMAVALQRAWAPGQPQAARLIDAALVLCADHELDAAALAACIAASTGASPNAAVMAALATGGGLGHIGGCMQA
ncbi:MAG: hypothetical protein EXS38_02810, partial [Opitutus sp.]|nr:hypothetical protein [Opitutus sp.]